MYPSTHIRSVETDFNPRAICWLNGRVLPIDEANVSVLDHGLLYGDGVFEGIRFYNGHAFRLAAHLKRLADSAAAINLVIPFQPDELDAAVRETIDAFGQPEGYLRLVVTRGIGRLGLDPSSCRHPSVFLIADQLALVPRAVRQRGARVIVAATRRISVDALDPRIKSLNYLNHILARMEATRADADEAILLNTAGHVTEGSADNVFIVRNGALLTPPVTDGALEGITRGAVLELAEQLDMPANETTLGAYDLYTADECFLTGTGAELIPVRDIDGRTLKQCPGPVFEKIQAAFHNLVADETR